MKAPFGMEVRRLKVHHQTTYTFDQPVFLEPHFLRFKPAPGPHISVSHFNLNVMPVPAGLSMQSDQENNQAHFCWFDGMHTSLEVEMNCEVKVRQFNPFNYLVYPPHFLKLPFEYPNALINLLRPHLETERLSDNAELYLKKLLEAEGKNTTGFISRLNAQISEDFRLSSRDEGAPLDPSETFRLKVGSCRDLAWMHIHFLRRAGIASRFVSGYYYVEGDKPEFELHAWVEAYIPGAGWLGFDSGHGLAVADSHIAVAKSAHYQHTMPITGTIRGEATSSLSFDLHIEQLD